MSNTNVHIRCAIAALQLLLATALCLSGCASDSTIDSDTLAEAAKSLNPSWFAGDLGSRTAYAVELSGTVQSVDGRGTSQQLELAGNWHLSKVTAAPSPTEGSDVILGRLRVEQLQLPTRHVRAVSAEDYSARIRHELERPTLLVQDSSGQVVGIHAPADLVSTALVILKSLASGLQFSNGGPGDGTWTADESDTTGRYEASYARTLEGGLIRQKLRYVELTDPSAPVSDFKIEETLTRFNVDENLRITAGEGHEVLTFQGDDALPALRSATRFSFRLAESQELPEVDTADLQRLPLLPLSAPTPDLGLRYEMDLSRLPGELDLTATLAQLDGLRGDTTPEGRGTRRRLQMVLRAGVRLSRETERDAWQLLGHSKEHTHVLLHALANSDRVGTLTRLMKTLAATQPLSLQQRVQGILAVSTNEWAPSEVIDGLQELTNEPELGDVALLGLGALAYRVQYDPSRSEKLAQLLFSHLQQAQEGKDRSRTELALRAIGNAGSVSLLPAIDKLLYAPDPKVQALAVTALRRIDDASIDERLKRIAATSDNDKVLKAVKRVQSERGAD